MTLLDTNIISELMRPEPEAVVMAWLDKQFRDEVHISSITKAEIEMALFPLAWNTKSSKNNMI